MTASMCPKSTSYPSMYMYRIFQTYFLRLYPFMCASAVNFWRMCAISFSTRLASCSLLVQLRRSDIKTVRPRRWPPLCTPPWSDKVERQAGAVLGIDFAAAACKPAAQQRQSVHPHSFLLCPRNHLRRSCPDAALRLRARRAPPDRAASRCSCECEPCTQLYCRPLGTG